MTERERERGGGGEERERKRERESGMERDFWKIRWCRATSVCMESKIFYQSTKHGIVAGNVI